MVAGQKLNVAGQVLTDATCVFWNLPLELTPDSKRLYGPAAINKIDCSKPLCICGAKGTLVVVAAIWDIVDVTLGWTNSHPCVSSIEQVIASIQDNKRELDNYEKMLEQLQ
eukprot:4955064-Amphidinium_carterae.1